jgi:AraC family transcriptional regulator
MTKARPITHAHRQRLERAADHYLRYCYRHRTAARVSEFASYIHRTPEYLNWLARNAVGESLRDFLRRKQLVYAAQLLTTTPLTLAEIAQRAAFGTVGTFHRCFSAAYGMPPGRFRVLRK